MHACTCIRNFPASRNLDDFQLCRTARFSVHLLTNRHNLPQLSSAQFTAPINLPLTHHPRVVRKFCRREFAVCSLSVACRHDITFWLLDSTEQLSHIISSRRTQILAEGKRSYRHSDSVSTEHRNTTNRRLISHNLASCFVVFYLAGDDENDESRESEE
jgi:hypothetical protein